MENFYDNFVYLPVLRMYYRKIVQISQASKRGIAHAHGKCIEREVTIISARPARF